MPLINPEIIFEEGEVDYEEGCLSVPDCTEKMKRREKVRVKGISPEGEEMEIAGEGILSIALQHEIDHLNGVLILDRISPSEKGDLPEQAEEGKTEGRKRLTILSWRIVFFGTPSFAVPTLKVLLEGPDEVVAVVTQPDRKKGRGQKVAFSPVKELVSQYRKRKSPFFNRKK